MSDEEPKQHVVLCEGFDDRSFWAGWLLHLGCTDPTDRGKRRALDAWGRPVSGGGRYLFRTPGGSSVIVHPFDGRSNAGKTAGEYLRGQVYRPDQMVLNLDSDAENGSADGARAAFRQIVEQHGGKLEDDGDGPFDLDGVRVSAVIWECGDTDPTPGVPRKQTLERLVAAAIQAAYPARGPVVDEWLAAKPRGRVPKPKNYGYSYLAKWYAEHGADDFFRAIWREQEVANRLRERLEETGAWATVASLVADQPG